MKRILIISFILIIILIISKPINTYTLPKETIRFRIIPNSNSIKDLYIKEEVKKGLSKVIKEIELSSNVDEVRININNNLEKIKEEITSIFIKNNYHESFTVNYGSNYFPEKEYKGIKYESGNYESLVIKIGKEEGDNYWCVLFPPLCLLEAKEEDDVEYKFFISEIIKKYIKKD